MLWNTATSSIFLTIKPKKRVTYSMTLYICAIILFRFFLLRLFTIACVPFAYKMIAKKRGIVWKIFLCCFVVLFFFIFPFWMISPFSSEPAVLASRNIVLVLTLKHSIRLTNRLTKNGNPEKQKTITFYPLVLRMLLYESKIIIDCEAEWHRW